MKHICSFSGGLGSWMAARRVVAEYGVEDTYLLFTDTLIEDSDLYRFLIEAAANVLKINKPEVKFIASLADAIPIPAFDRMQERRDAIQRMRSAASKVLPRLVWLSEGRTPWEVFEHTRFLGNSRSDACSRILKRESADRWLANNCDPSDTTVYVGIDWTERHRFYGTTTKLGLARRKSAQGWKYAAPLCEPPYLHKSAMFAMLAAFGIRRPRLYDLGAAHNNCGGGCIKQGMGGFARLLNTQPDMYHVWVEGEERIQRVLGKKVTILRDRSGGTTTPLSLREFANRVGCGNFDKDDVGGCGCFIDDDSDDTTSE